MKKFRASLFSGSKKGALSEEAVYIVVCFVVTSLIFAGIFLIPESTLKYSLETNNLENQIYNERIYNEISNTELYTKRLQKGVITNFNSDALQNSFNENKKIGFRLDIGGNEIFFNQDFFEYAKPLTPIRFKAFEQKRNVVFKGQNVLQIEQVYDDQQ